MRKKSAVALASWFMVIPIVLEVFMETKCNMLPKSMA